MINTSKYAGKMTVNTTPILYNENVHYVRLILSSWFRVFFLRLFLTQLISNKRK